MTLRGAAKAAAAKTKCDAGHELAGDNVSIVNGKRVCLTCGREKTRRYRTRKGITQRGRRPRGEEHGMAKLTEEDVREIRASSLSQRELGRMYGVSRTLIGYVKHGVIWKHVQ